MSAEFAEAVGAVKGLRARPTDAELLRLYGLYKQATDGPCTAARPPFYDFRGCAKWNEWRKLSALTKQQAEREYIGLVSALLSVYN